MRSKSLHIHACRCLRLRPRSSVFLCKRNKQSLNRIKIRFGVIVLKLHYIVMTHFDLRRFKFH